MEGFRNKLPLALYNQPIRGKNHCLNLVLDQVRNNLEPDELIVFTDDDTLPSPDWLEAFQKRG